jgi:hypothetical protein
VVTVQKVACRGKQATEGQCQSCEKLTSRSHAR